MLTLIPMRLIFLSPYPLAPLLYLLITCFPPPPPLLHLNANLAINDDPLLLITSNRTKRKEMKAGRRSLDANGRVPSLDVLR